MEPKESWHLRKELSIGTLLSLLTIGAGSILAYADMRNELDHKASDIAVELIGQKQQQFSADLNEIKTDLKEILREQRALSNRIED